MVYANIIHVVYIPNDLSTTQRLPFLVWGGIRTMSGKLQLQTVSKDATCSLQQLLGLLFTHSRCGTYSQAETSLLPTVSKHKFDYSFLYLFSLQDQFSATKDSVVHLDT